MTSGQHLEKIRNIFQKNCKLAKIFDENSNSVDFLNSDQFGAVERGSVHPLFATSPGIAVAV